MGKKKLKNQAYDKEAMQFFAKILKHFRTPIEARGLPLLSVNLERLEELIKGLSNKERETLEKYWGLIPGTPNHGANMINTRTTGSIAVRNMMNDGFNVMNQSPMRMFPEPSRQGTTITVKKANDIAMKNMANSACNIMKDLILIENMCCYDEQAKEVVQNLCTKFNKSGLEGMSEIEMIKYFLIFLIFFYCGPKMVFEEDNKELIDKVQEENGHFDEYALLRSAWEQTACNLEDDSINLKLLIEAIQMFDLKDVIAMKKFARLPISKDDFAYETPTLESFADIRRFKERIFPEGAWDVTTALIYAPGYQPMDLSFFAKQMQIFRKDWSKIEDFKKEEEKTIHISTGEKKLSLYEIGDLPFTDSYEIMFLYVCRNIL